MTDIAIRLQGIGKSFGTARILDGIDIEIGAGSVHALVGQNGAGKSSVGKIIGGYYSADAGRLEVFGAAVTRFSPREALSRGIAMIHQELQLVPGLSVVQNVFLGQESQRGGLLRRGDLERFAALEAACGFGLDPRARVAGLRIADRQKVEIMRAIARRARVIIMDEPTSSLTEDEARRLHDLIARLKSQGVTVIYVSHFLDHVLAHCDRVTVMRDGRVVRSGDIAAETRDTLVASMLDRAPSDISWPALPAAPRADAAPVAEMRGVATATGLSGIDLVLRPGEIVGLIGLVGSGRTELARAMFGADPITAGSYSIAGAVQRRLGIPRAVAQGVAFVPEDRRKQGLVPTQATRANMSLASLGAVSRAGFLDRRAERDRTRRMIGDFGIVPAAVDGRVAFYSGGNQQKVLLSKWAATRPRLLILDEPSRGVDIGARQRIHDFIVDMAAAGTAVLLISSELEEVINLSHRGYLMSEGRIFAGCDCRTTTAEAALARIFRQQGRAPSPAASAADPARKEAAS